MLRNFLSILILPFFLSIIPFSGNAQDMDTDHASHLYDATQWRCIGPWRGGRSCAVAGVVGQPDVFYFGSTGGGVWRSDDGGRRWENVSDGFFGGSIGAVAVSAFDPNVIYVGGGEKTVRGNVSSGNGVWKSVDAGKTWSHVGLEESAHISRIRIHPQNPDVAYAAVMGNLYKPHEQRGVYKTTDGGATWKRVLFASAEAGAVDLCMDPSNPRILYASTWKIRRTPYSLESGGEGSGIWKSTDSGETWTEITRNEGLPSGTLGIIGLAVSPVQPERVWAIVEAENGGVFRSDNGGQTWKRLNQDRNLRQRAWYYSRIYADPQDEDVVHVLNVAYHTSKDGGKTFSRHVAPHGDHHDLWIAPEDPNRMIIGDDGGAQVTYDGGRTWSTYHNQPTAQFYRVTTDQSFPFRIYAAQQDNSTIRIRHRTDGRSISERDWESTAGCECGHIAIDPRDNDIVYGGCYGGLLEKENHRTGESRSINVWPDNPMGHGAEGMKYRFQWNFPIFISPHDPDKLYTASNHLHLSTNQGHSWEVISPDLTRNDSTKLGPSGGPITKDNTSVEYYCTIFAAAESPLREGLIWTGSDDGLVHLTRDGGETWENVTPDDLPEWAMINSIAPDPHNEAGAWIAATRYKLGENTPYLYHTTDYGANWKLLTNGIDKAHFTRVVRPDPDRKGLLYAGTEAGMYVSWDSGAHWHTFQLNLPIVPVTDLAIKDYSLIAATQGRSLWMIDDLSPIRNMHDSIRSQPIFLFPPKPAYRMGGGSNPDDTEAGVNHPNGAIINYYVREFEEHDTFSLTILTEYGDTIRRFSTHPTGAEEVRLEVNAGSNQFIWDMQYPGATGFDDMVLWWSSMNGPRVAPGQFSVVASLNGNVQKQALTVLQDPRSSSSQSDIEAQVTFLLGIRDKVTEAHKAISRIRAIRPQIEGYTSRLPADSTFDAIREAGARIDSTLTAIEEALYQTKNRSPQDPLNFPIRLTNKLAHLNSLFNQGDYPPTAQALAVRDELANEITRHLQALDTTLKSDIKLFNELCQKSRANIIIIDKSPP